MSSDGLNIAQQEAVNYLHGPCLVLAGAGSGKTRVITHKIARLIQAGLEPKRIAAITFTNKAAAEMRERAKGLIGARAAREVVICTFHALGVRMLREDGEALNLKPNFSILDSDDVLSLLKVTSTKFHQTLVMITHNNEIAQLADRIIRIEDGKIVQ